MRRAVTIGINDYPGFDADLAGCVADARNWAGYLASQDFWVQMLIDSEATRDAIVAAIGAMLMQLESGEVGVVTYSGHGTWIPDLEGDEADRRDEAWVPVDADANRLVLDDDLAQLFQTRPPGTKVFVVSDSCHSGTMLRFAGPPGGKRKIRYLPPTALIPAEAAGPIARCERMRPSLRRRRRQSTLMPEVVFISGCDDHEYSADALIEGQPCGAFSHHLLQAFVRLGGGVTPAALFREVRKSLPSWDWPQTPQLHCEKGLLDRPVLR